MDSEQLRKILIFIGVIGYHCFFITGVITAKIKWIILSFISLGLLFIGFLLNI